MSSHPSFAEQKLTVYRGRYDEASQIVDALRTRRRNLLHAIVTDDLDGKDTTIDSRRLQQTDDELDLAQVNESAAWFALRAEERRDHPTHQPREARR